jgi:dihydrofolate reductase
MIISLIAAMAENGVIGKNNQLPWHLPEDLKHFKKCTLGKPIIMGRHTFESINSKPLTGRHNIIMSRDLAYLAPGCTVVHSIPEALKVVGEVEEVMVIGGSKIFELFLPLASRLYLTIVHELYTGDSYFPHVDWSQWKTVSEEDKGLFSIKIFNRKQ